MMDEQDEQLHEQLLREWHFRREMVNYYSGALLRLLPDDRDVHRRRRDLNAKLALTVLALIQVSDQLQAHERCHAPACLACP